MMTLLTELYFSIPKLTYTLVIDMDTAVDQRAEVIEVCTAVDGIVCQFDKHTLTQTQDVDKRGDVHDLIVEEIEHLQLGH